MTECITDSVQFSSVGRREVVADFLGGRLTSDAGILLLKEVDQRIGLLDAINDAIPDPRKPVMTVHGETTEETTGGETTGEGTTGDRQRDDWGQATVLRETTGDRRPF